MAASLCKQRWFISLILCCMLLTVFNVLLSGSIWQHAESYDPLDGLVCTPSETEKSIDSAECDNCTEVHLDELQWNDLNDPSLSPPFDIDIVISWAGPRNTNNQRSRDNGELRYCLRSIYEHIPWFHTIFLLVNPSTKISILNGSTFINESAVSMPLNRVRVIGIDEIFRNKSNAVNQHSSEAIESNIHRIPALSSFYIYFCDDFFIGRHLHWRFFFEEQFDRQNQHRLIPRVPYYVYNVYRYRRESVPIPCLEATSLEKEEIPYQNGKCMVNGYIEHIPRAYYKSDWIQFEEEYPAFFQFIESFKSRFRICNKTKLSLNKIWIHRWVNGDIEMNKMYIPYYDAWLALIARFKWWGSCIVKGLNHCVPPLMNWSVYHHWIYNQNSELLSALKFNLNGILKDKPLTFNINDNYPDTDYHEHQRQFTMAMEQYYPIKSPLERK